MTNQEVPNRRRPRKPQRPSETLSNDMQLYILALVLLTLSACCVPNEIESLVHEESLRARTAKVARTTSLDLVDELKESTHVIKIGGKGKCNGLAVSENTLLTAKHCIEDSRGGFFRVTKIDGRDFSHIDQLITFYENTDIALVHFDGNVFTTYIALPVQRQKSFDCHIGTIALIASNLPSEDDDRVYAAPIVNSEFPNCKLNLTAIRGQSGSPIFNKFGLPIGVLVAIDGGNYDIGTPYSLFAAIPPSAIEDVNNNSKLPTETKPKLPPVTPTIPDPVIPFPGDIEESNKTFEECMTTELPDATFEERLEHCK